MFFNFVFICSFGCFDGSPEIVTGLFPIVSVSGFKGRCPRWQGWSNIAVNPRFLVGVDADGFGRNYIIYTLPDETRDRIWIRLYVITRMILILCHYQNESWPFVFLVFFFSFFCQFNCLLFFQKSSRSCGLWFSSIFWTLNPFQYWNSSFLMTTEGLIHNYFKSCKHSLILKKQTQCFKDLQKCV